MWSDTTSRNHIGQGIRHAFLHFIEWAFRGMSFAMIAGHIFHRTRGAQAEGGPRESNGRMDRCRDSGSTWMTSGSTRSSVTAN